MWYKWARNKKLLDKEMMSNNDSRSLRKKDTGKARCFIYHYKGHFSKKEAQFSKETMEVDKFLIEDEVLYSKPNNIPKCVCSTNA